jgi:hypothetical protein
MRRAQGARARRLHEVPRRRPAALHRWHSKRPAASCLPAPSCCQAQVQATAAARHKCRPPPPPGTSAATRCSQALRDATTAPPGVPPQSLGLSTWTQMGWPL